MYACFQSEDDEELLKNLKALDFCGEFDDNDFSKTVQNFLERCEKGMFAMTDELDPAVGSLADPTKLRGAGEE